jgi:hypothetical protein
MVRIPKTYVKFEYEDPYWRWWISPTPATGFSLHPAFYQRDNHAAATNQIYVGAYTASASGGTTAANSTYNTLKSTDWTGLKLTSKSGVKNLTGDGSSSGTMAQFETAATAIGTGWGLTNFHTLNLMQLLFYIEYASFDSQTKVGPGRTNSASTLASGGASAYEASNGTSSGTTDVQAVSWRGIENLWGNIWQFIPGYNTTDTEHHILNRDGTGTVADVLTAGNYEAVTSPIPLNGTSYKSGTDGGDYCHGYISALARDASNVLSLSFVPDALVGISSTYLTDYFYSHDVGQTGILRSGGHWASAGYAGIGCRNSGDRSSNSNAAIGGRIEFIG